MKTKLFLSMLLSVFIFTDTFSQNNEVWGLTLNGGTYNGGTIFSIDASNGTYSVKHHFNPPDGYHPYGNLLFADDGNLYGTCYDGGSFASCTIFRFDPNTNNYLDVHSFDITHGDYPRSGVIQGPGGILYGAATSGGANWSGVLYSWNTNTNTYTVLHDFIATSGSTPIASPLVHTNGKLYGLTSQGGINSSGVLYSFDLNTGTYLVEHAFNTLEGTNPSDNLLLGSDGKIYGVTPSGGQNNNGTLFSFEPATSIFTTLHYFVPATGFIPKGGLIEDAASGLLYGVCSYGGTASHGTIYSFNINTLSYSCLYNFNGSDGEVPVGNLYLDGDILSGSCSSGGDFSFGTLFNFNTVTSTFAKTHDFTGLDGNHPNGGFITANPTGIASAKSENFNFYPNPSNGTLNFMLPDLITQDAEVIIYNSEGKPVVRENAVMLRNKTGIHLRLAPGIYSLEFNNNSSRSVRKLVII